MSYNSYPIMQMFGHFADAQHDGNHALANHNFTGQLTQHMGSAGMTNGVTPVDTLNLIHPFVQALNDPNHPLANHPATAALRSDLDAVHAANPALGLISSGPQQSSQFQAMPLIADRSQGGGPQMFPMQVPNLSNNPSNPGFDRVSAPSPLGLAMSRRMNG